MSALDTARSILEKAAGSAQAEVFLTQSESRTSEWSEGKPENQFFTQAQGYGLRLVEQGRLGFASANSFGPDAVDQVIRDARAALISVSPDADLVLPEPQADKTTQESLDVVDPDLNPRGFAGRAAFLEALEADIRKRDTRLTKVLRASYREGRSTECVVNSRGVAASEEGTFASFSLACVAVQGNETQVGYGFHAARHARDVNIAGVVDKTVQQTLALLNGKQVPSGRYDLILDPQVSAEILDLFAHALRADQVQRGKSFLGTKRSAYVGSTAVSIIDEPRRKQGLASARVDAEGQPTRNRTFVERGILQDFLYDSVTARRDGRQESGNATRASYKSLPEPGVSNFYIRPGVETPEELIGGVKRGLYIHNVMGLHTVDTISGDFSLGIMGEFIDKGVRTHGVRGVTIGGNLLDILMNIDAAGADLTFAGSMGSPTLRVRDISVGGI
jgi:PmbA protein